MDVGYQWTVDSGLSLATAFGARRVWSASLYATAPTTTDGYLRVGYAF